MAAIVKYAGAPALSPRAAGARPAGAGGSYVPALASLALAIVAFGVFLAAMAYPWQLALLSGTAIGALAYSAWGTWRRMRSLYQRPAADDLMIIGGDGLPRPIDGGLELSAPGRRLTPGKKRQGGHEQQVQGATQDETGHEQQDPAREEHTGQE